MNRYTLHRAVHVFTAPAGLVMTGPPPWYWPVCRALDWIGEGSRQAVLGRLAYTWEETTCDACLAIRDLGPTPKAEFKPWPSPFAGLAIMPLDPTEGSVP